MAWSAPNTVATGDIYTAAMYNTYVKDNSIVLRSNTGNGDPASANLVAVSSGAGVTAWGTVPDAAMTNQKINKVNPIYSSFNAAAAVIGNSGIFDIVNAGGIADAPDPARTQYHCIQSMKNNGAITFTVQEAIDTLYTTPVVYKRVIVSGTPSSWYKVWNAANGGSGSGLDADLLDGINLGNASGLVPISNGTKCVNLNADLFDGYNAGNASGDIPISNGTLCTNLNAALLGGIAHGLVTPIVGEVRLYFGNTESVVAAKGWKFLNGQSLSRTTFSDLYALIGTTYGLGANSPVNTTFALPDLREKFPVGFGAAYTLGTSGGSATKNISHTHNIEHKHAYSGTAGATSNTNGEYTNGGKSAVTVGHTHPYSGTTAGPLDYSNVAITLSGSGGSTTQDILPPYLPVNFIIYTGVAS